MLKAIKKLYLVEDSVLFRTSVRKAMEGSPYFSLVGESEDVEGLVAEITRTMPDVILLDLRLRKSNGMDIIKTLKSNFPKLKVVIYTMQADMKLFLEAIKRGADGYMLKTTHPQILSEGLRQVLEDKFITSPEIRTNVPVSKAG